MPLPLFKLVTVLVKQASKPVTSYLQARAVTSFGFRKGCISLAQKIHRWEQWTLRNFYGTVSSLPVGQLDEDRAVQLGTAMLGEMVVFGVAGATLFYEYRRGAAKESAKEDKLSAELAKLHLEVRQLQEENDRIIASVRPEWRRERCGNVEKTTFDESDSLISRLLNKMKTLVVGE